MSAPPAPKTTAPTTAQPTVASLVNELFAHATPRRTPPPTPPKANPMTAPLPAYRLFRPTSSRVTNASGKFIVESATMTRVSPRHASNVAACLRMPRLGAVTRTRSPGLGSSWAISGETEGKTDKARTKAAARIAIPPLERYGVLRRWRVVVGRASYRGGASVKRRGQHRPPARR